MEIPDKQVAVRVMVPVSARELEKKMQKLHQVLRFMEPDISGVEGSFRSVGL